MKPPSKPDLVAVTSSGTGQSYRKIIIRASVLKQELKPTPFFAGENVILEIGP